MSRIGSDAVGRAYHALSSSTVIRFPTVLGPAFARAAMPAR